MEISKPGYLKQRMKLNPLAFYELYRHHNRNFYAEPGFSAFHGYLVLAADGSGINIPTTRETLEEFGTSSRKGTKPQASIGLGCLYDVMNRMILESDCCKCKFDEMRLAEEQIDRIPETIGTSQPFLVIMDRGIPVHCSIYSDDGERHLVSCTSEVQRLQKRAGRFIRSGHMGGYPVRQKPDQTL